MNLTGTNGSGANGFDAHQLAWSFLVVLVMVLVVVGVYVLIVLAVVACHYFYFYLNQPQDHQNHYQDHTSQCAPDPFVIVPVRSKQMRTNKNP